MSTKGSAANLVQAAKDLANEWEQTKSHWHDVKSHEFEERYLEELPAHVRRAALMIEEVDVVLRKIRSECE
jgi:uncharacterized membrane protein YgaE (UPF0421/DUF939 family)